MPTLPEEFHIPVPGIVTLPVNVGLANIVALLSFVTFPNPTIEAVRPVRFEPLSEAKYVDDMPAIFPDESIRLTFPEPN